MRANQSPAPQRIADKLSEPLDTIAEALGRLRYGTIQLTVHDGKVMQVDVTERRRFAD
jgi:hypothetical protein